MHLDEIVAAVERAGLRSSRDASPSSAARKAAAVAAVLRTDGRFVLIAPRTYTLEASDDADDDDDDDDDFPFEDADAAASPLPPSA